MFFKVSEFCRADLYEDEAIQLLLKYKPPWEKELKSIKSGKSEELSGNFCLLLEKIQNRIIISTLYHAYNIRHGDISISVKITDEEREKMLKLPRKEYIL